MFYVCLQDRELSFLEHVHSGISNEIKHFCGGVKNIFPFLLGGRWNPWCHSIDGKQISKDSQQKVNLASSLACFTLSRFLILASSTSAVC